MNKFSLVLGTLLFAFTLSACQSTADNDSGDILSCDASQTLSDGVCVDVASPTVALSGDWVGYGYDVTSSDTSVQVSYTDIPGDWWVVNTQFIINAIDTTRGSVIFTFTGVEGHSYLFKIEGDGVFTELSSVATGEEQTLTLDLTTFTQAQRALLNLLVVFVQTPGAQGSLYLHSVAYGNVADSAEPIVQTPQLPTPFGVLIQFETEVAWGAIPEAQSFDVWVHGVEGSPFKVDAGFFAFNLNVLNLPQGNYIIQIKANGDGETLLDSLWSPPIVHLVDFDPGTPGAGNAGAAVLPTPFGMVIENGELMWGSIPEASSFEVYIDGISASPFTVPAGFFALRLDTLNLPTGIHLIQIKALGDGVNHVDSLLTIPIPYVVE